MKNHGSVMQWIERRFLGPAVGMMFLGLIIRGVAIVLSMSIPYNTWPIWLRIGIEVIIAFAMVGCADVIFGAASRQYTASRRQIRTIRTSPDYMPRAGLNPAKYQVEAQRLSVARELAIKSVEDESKPQWLMMLFCVVVTVTYGLSFAALVMRDANPAFIIIEILGVASVPVFTWYVSTHHTTSQESPGEHAESIATGAINKRLLEAQERFAKGEETADDLSLVRQGVGASPFHVALVKSLMHKVEGEVYYAAKELYTLFGAVTPSDQASIRRIVLRAGRDEVLSEKLGIRQSDDGKTYLIPKSAIVDLFPRYINKVALARTQMDIPRSNIGFQPASSPILNEHVPSSARTPS